jgi:hypothetical protein
MRTLVPVFAASVIMAVLILADVAKPLGAHPWWSQQTLLIGTPLGLIIATAAGLTNRRMFFVGLFIVTTIIGYATASYGKSLFVASFAEDIFAGKLWYFGWIGTGAAMAALVTALAQVVVYQYPKTVGGGSS